jgi:acyl-coenzyme A thioesterase PaaI-like protein
MTSHDSALKTLRSEGWTEIADDGFVDLVGPFFHRTAGGGHEYAVVAQTKHRNIRGVVQGGLLMTFADRTMGLAAYREAKHALATIQMDTQFVDSAKIGEVLLSRPRVIRGTRSLIFMSTEVKVGERCIILASAVFKISKPRE